MEKQLFTWTNWDISDTASFLYYDPILIVDMGQFKKGDKFRSALVDYENGKLKFYNDEEDAVAVFDLSLNFVPQGT